MRGEITGALAAQHAALSYGIAALAIFFVALAGGWTKAPSITAIALMTVVPWGVLFVFSVWGTEIGRMRRCGAYLAGYLEPRINAVAGVRNALSWERWLASKTPSLQSSERVRSRSLNLGVGMIGITLGLLAVTAFAVGVYKFDQRAHVARHLASARALRAGNARRRHASAYYQGWHLPTANTRGVLRAWEFWTFFLAGLALPAGYAGVLVTRNRRTFPEEELPDWKPPTSASSGASGVTGPRKTKNQP